MSNLPDLQKGDILLINNKNFNLFSIGQRLFTGQPYTHTAIGIGNILGVPSYIGADQTVDIQRFQNLWDSDEDFQIWRPLVPQEDIDAAIKWLYETYAGKTYGYQQIPWFIYRWANENFLRKNVKHNVPWFSSNSEVICSELAWHCLYKIYVRYGKILDILNWWNPKCFHAGDSKTVVYETAKFNLIKKIDERWSGKY